MTKQSKGKHSKTIDQIIRRCVKYGHYAVYDKEHEYDLRDGTHGEADLIMYREVNGKIYATIFEVKSTDTMKGRNYATKVQLPKDEVYVHQQEDVNRCFLFYAFPDKDEKYGVRLEKQQCYWR